jgi:hypothetical protein
MAADIRKVISVFVCPCEGFAIFSEPGRAGKFFSMMGAALPMDFSGL